MFRLVSLNVSHCAVRGRPTAQCSIGRGRQKSHVIGFCMMAQTIEIGNMNYLKSSIMLFDVARQAGSKLDK